MPKSRLFNLGFATKLNSKIVYSITFFISMLAGSVNAAEPKPWQMNFQPAATPVMEKITDFHNLLLIH